MDKTIYSGSILISLFLIAGSVWFPEDASMWLASSSLSMNIARGLLIVLMVGLLLTDPPRRREFRLLLGAVSLGFAAWAVNWLFSGTVAMVDTLVFFEASTAFALAAIEAESLAVNKVPMVRSVEYPSLFAQSFHTTSNMQGLVLPSVRIAERIQRAVMMGTVITGALSQNSKPYRELWRGS